MKKHTTNDKPGKKSATQQARATAKDPKQEAKKAAKSIDTANRDAQPDDRRSGM